MVKEHPLNVRSWPLCPTPTTERSPEPLEIDKALTLRRQCTDALWFVPRGFVWTFVHLRIKFTSNDWHQLWKLITVECWVFLVLNEAFVYVYCFRVVVSCIANCALAMCLFVIRAWPSFGVGLKHAGGHTVTIAKGLIQYLVSKGLGSSCFVPLLILTLLLSDQNWMWRNSMDSWARCEVRVLEVLLLFIALTAIWFGCQSTVIVYCGKQW